MWRKRGLEQFTVDAKLTFDLLNYILQDFHVVNVCNKYCLVKMLHLSTHVRHHKFNYKVQYRSLYVTSIKYETKFQFVSQTSQEIISKFLYSFVLKITDVNISIRTECCSKWSGKFTITLSIGSKAVYTNSILIKDRYTMIFSISHK